MAPNLMPYASLYILGTLHMPMQLACSTLTPMSASFFCAGFANACLLPQADSGAADKPWRPAKRSVLDAPGSAHPQLRRSTRGRQTDADATAAGTGNGGAPAAAPASAPPCGAQRLPAATPGENGTTADDHSEAAGPDAARAAELAINATSQASNGQQPGAPAVPEQGSAVMLPTESTAVPPIEGQSSVGDRGARADGHAAPAMTSKEEKHLEAIFGAQPGAETVSANHAPAATPGQVS